MDFIHSIALHLSDEVEDPTHLNSQNSLPYPHTSSPPNHPQLSDNPSSNPTKSVAPPHPPISKLGAAISKQPHPNISHLLDNTSSHYQIIVMPLQQPRTNISNASKRGLLQPLDQPVSKLDTTVAHFPDITSLNHSTSYASHPNSNSHPQPNISNISHSHPHQNIPNISNSLPQQNISTISNSHPHLSNLQTNLPTTTSVYPSSSSTALLSPSNSISNSPPTLVPPTTSIHDSCVIILIADLNSTSSSSFSSFVPKRTHPMVLRNMSTPKALLAQPSVWRQAMTDEINALIRNGTTLVTASVVTPISHLSKIRLLMASWLLEGFVRGVWSACRCLRGSVGGSAGLGGSIAPLLPGLGGAVSGSIGCVAGVCVWGVVQLHIHVSCIFMYLHVCNNIFD
ncbi:hypothetical protein U1Q18_047755 [Sarracenia purpurea var. burkii]